MKKIPMVVSILLSILFAVEAVSAQIPGLPRIRPVATPTPTAANTAASPDSDFHFIGESHMDGRSISPMRVCAPGMPTVPPVARGFMRWINGIRDADAWRSFEQGECGLVVYGVGARYSHRNIDSLASVAKGRSVYVVENARLKLVKDLAAAGGTGSTSAIPMVPPQGRASLVFSRSPIDPANPSNLTNTFTAGDHIYGLLILDRPLKEFVTEQSVRHAQLGYSVNRPALSVEFKIDGNIIYDGTHHFVWDLENRTNAWDSVPATDRYFHFDVAPDPAKAKTYGYAKMHFDMLSAAGRPGNRARAGAQFYSHHIGRLGSGSHKVEFRIMGKTTISGSFNITDGNYASYAQLATKLDEAAAATAVMPTAQRKDPAMETSMRTAVRAAGNTDTVLRVVITNPDWFVQRNALGQIVFRGIFGAIAFRKPDGTCYFYQAYFKQNYSSGRYGATRQDGTPGRNSIACANVNK
ncbi:MAG TPA: hypothetical protein PKD26_15905 [Pyrinomonadaceae bacterium]|nr:hypothetical protein [Pyrinomonadaceae bacterium]